MNKSRNSKFETRNSKQIQNPNTKCSKQGVPLELANGDVITYPYGLCKFEYEGELVNGTVIIGPTGIEPIAGTHVLQDFRLVLEYDSASQSHESQMI